MDKISDTTTSAPVLKPENKKPSRTLRMIKWIVFVACLLAVAIFVASTIGVNKLRSARAGAQVNTFVTKLYPSAQVAGKVCQGEDTNNDSYVSCAVNVSESGNSRLINIQCPTIIKSFLGTSCKLSPTAPTINS